MTTNNELPEPQQDEEESKKRLTKEELLERRTEIQQLRNRGLSVRKIADQMNVSIATVSRDLETAAKEGIKDVKNYNREKFIADTVTGYDDIWSACWNIYMDTPDKELKLKALAQARQTLNDKRKSAQETGLVRKEHSNTGLNVNMNLISGLTPEQIQAFALNIIENQTMTTELLLPEPDENSEPVPDILDAEIVENDDISEVPAMPE